jgi:hypothetical protein
MWLRRRLLLTFMLLGFVMTYRAANACTGNAVMAGVVTRRSPNNSTFNTALGIRRIHSHYEWDRYRTAQSNRFHLKTTSIHPSMKKLIGARLVPLDGARRRYRLHRVDTWRPSSVEHSEDSSRGWFRGQGWPAWQGWFHQ